ncbi:hypothetical protein P154DRAFT_367764 [Amniculicola lignicola CBS 123094]|uniref:Uncharacterized protein n=1 Tax=Amniculicola lignicola CBS 123094 TaxID=1392246 RepID=A0A6A5WAM5_9PLEO|nr:hypothetical protein P154DRAFT_367764 [Amniculicola lignicola CBS 123094]
MSELSPDQFNSLRHWSLYGQRGEPAAKRAISTDWNTHTFEKPVTSPWNQQISRTELPKLLQGFQPGGMEDKWFVYADGPDAQGNAVLHMFRSWTGYKLIELELVIELNEDGEVMEKDSYITEITWESNNERIVEQTEEKAKTMAKEVCNWVLGVKLP